MPLIVYFTENRLHAYRMPPPMNTLSPGVALSQFARGLSTETAFDVLAVARRLKAQGKDVIELQIGDSPFNSTASAIEAGLKAIKDNQSHYCPSLGVMS